jgi:hypothetical protein
MHITKIDPSPLVRFQSDARREDNYSNTFSIGLIIIQRTSLFLFLSKNLKVENILMEKYFGTGSQGP